MCSSSVGRTGTCLPRPTQAGWAIVWCPQHRFRGRALRPPDQGFVRRTSPSAGVGSVGPDRGGEARWRPPAAFRPGTGTGTGTALVHPRRAAAGLPPPDRPAAESARVAAAASFPRSRGRRRAGGEPSPEPAWPDRTARPGPPGKGPVGGGRPLGPPDTMDRVFPSASPSRSTGMSAGGPGRRRARRRRPGPAIGRTRTRRPPAGLTARPTRRPRRRRRKCGAR